MANRGLQKLLKINEKAHLLREEKGFSIDKGKDKKKYKMKWADAISLATSKIYGNKNTSNSVDGLPRKKKKAAKKSNK